MKIIELEITICPFL